MRDLENNVVANCERKLNRGLIAQVSEYDVE
jgi:hypothetical protein